MAKTASGAQNELSYAQNYKLVKPADEAVIGVPVSQWNTLMHRIRTCGDSSQTYQSIGWACVGVAASALLAAVTFPTSVTWVQEVRKDGGAVESRFNVAAVLIEAMCATLFLAGMGIGIVSLLFARRHRCDRQELREVIAEDMQTIRDRHLPPTPAGPPVSPAQLIPAPPPAAQQQPAEAAPADPDPAAAGAQSPTPGGQP